MISRLCQPLLFAVVILGFLDGCIKSSPRDASTNSALVAEAQRYFSSSILSSGRSFNPANYRAAQPRSLNWAAARVEQLSVGAAVVVPVVYKNSLLVSIGSAPQWAYRLSDVVSLALIKNGKGGFYSMVVTAIPDTALVNPYGKLYLVEDWEGNRKLSRFRGTARKGGTSASDGVEADLFNSVEVCEDIVGYNYSIDDVDDGETWTETSCTTTVISDDDDDYMSSSLTTGDYAKVASTQELPAATVMVRPPTQRITDIADYLKCFTSGVSPTQTYSVQVCVEQPDPGTRTPWGLTSGGVTGSSAAGNVINAGHTFLVLSENDQGNVITRNVGFYPSGNVFPTSQSSQGALGNNARDPYNISVTVSVSGTQFFTILNYVMLGNNPGYYYNLSSNNCTTFAINAMAAGGITLPSTIGDWPGGVGNNPGDLGEDLRSMTLSSNMTRNTASSDHPNVGSCTINN